MYLSILVSIKNILLKLRLYAVCFSLPFQCFTNSIRSWTCIHKIWISMLSRRVHNIYTQFGTFYTFRTLFYFILLQQFYKNDVFLHPFVWNVAFLHNLSVFSAECKYENRLFYPRYHKICHLSLLDLNKIQLSCMDYVELPWEICCFFTWTRVRIVFVLRI